MNTCVMALPHFELTVDGLRSRIDDCPSIELNAAERAVYAQADGVTTLSELAIDQAHVAALRKLLGLGVVASVPVRAQTARAAARVCVIAPHPDDAALSCGGRLLQQLDRWHVTLVVAATRSTYACAAKLAGNVAAVSALRVAEEALFARRIGAKLHVCDLLDGALRSSGSPFRPPDASEQQLFDSAIDAAVAAQEPDIVFAPLGVGDHVDHLACASAVLRHFPQWRERNSALRLFLYEDLPYASDKMLEAMFRLGSLRVAGARLRPDCVRLDALIRKKVMAVSLYRSQPYQSYTQAILRHARLCGGEDPWHGSDQHAFHERVWELMEPVRGLESVLRPAVCEVPR